ncbi:MAG: hypothetical protein JWN34_698 [Bryobacterales bacterium]|nr:hypothetical protein [Bryobacterales bacterium]
MLAASVALSAADREVSFTTDVRPIFEKTCWTCHGPSVQLSGLSLATREAALKGGAHGAALVAGSADKSRLYRLAAGIDKPAMPIGGKLSVTEIETLKLWIDQGAKWDGAAAVSSAAPVVQDPPIRPEERNYWAFKLPVKPAVPSGNSNPVDAFIRTRLAAKGITPAPRADKATLVRRAYLDLIGLPPTPAETAAFINNNAPDAWPKLIDALLASPQYGERWGRHWLDVARYADSNGFEHDFDRPNAWRYRDYVIRAFNEDKPYDNFLREQIAGDEIAHVTNDSLIATGFLRSYAKVGYREKDNPEFRYEYLDDMIATIGRGILGLTVQCARCHDHKFDPIRQADYYRLQSSLWGYVEVDHPLVPKEQADEYKKRTAEVNTKLADLRSQIRDIDQPYKAKLLPAKYAKYPANVQAAIATPADQRTPGQKLLADQVIRAVNVSEAEIARIITPEDKARKQQLNTEIASVEKTRPAAIPMAMGVTDGDYRFTPDGPGDEPAPGKGKGGYSGEGTYVHEGAGRYQPPPSHFLLRGDVNSLGPETKPGFVKVATYGNPATELAPSTPHTSGRRLALAEWLVSRENPLTARVAVNRIWYNHFGRGIVSSVDNFGKMGEAPTHPELLDYLATEFIDRGWSMKQMHRLIMTSETYQMASDGTSDGNLAAFPQQRLDAETLRDSILAVSGGLNRKMEGPPVFPVIPKDILQSMTNGIWKQKDDTSDVWRRSIYIYRKRGLPMPLLEVFDLPNQNISCGVRNVTTVPTQALTLMNNEFVLKQANLFAQRLAETAPNDKGRQVDLAYQIALARAPRGEERSLALDFLKDHTLEDFAHVVINLNEFVYAR